MQFEISDEAALEFSRAFYEALGNGMPVDAAVAEARKSMSMALNNSVEWGTPVLYLRSPNGKIFDTQRLPAKRDASSPLSGAIDGSAALDIERPIRTESDNAIDDVRVCVSPLIQPEIPVTLQTNRIRSSLRLAAVFVLLIVVGIMGFSLSAAPSLPTVSSGRVLAKDDLYALGKDTPTATATPPMVPAIAQSSPTLVLAPTLLPTPSAMTSPLLTKNHPPLDVDAGTIWRNPADGAEYVFVPGGEMVMGADKNAAMSPHEQPSHIVTVADFWLQRTETTNRQYARCAEAGICTA